MVKGGNHADRFRRHRVRVRFESPPRQVSIACARCIERHRKSHSAKVGCFVRLWLRAHFNSSVEPDDFNDGAVHRHVDDDVSYLDNINDYFHDLDNINDYPSSGGSEWACADHVNRHGE